MVYKRYYATNSRSILIKIFYLSLGQTMQRQRLLVTTTLSLTKEWPLKYSAADV
jgi:hypothetical protein